MEERYFAYISIVTIFLVILSLIGCLLHFQSQNVPRKLHAEREEENEVHRNETHGELRRRNPRRHDEEEQNEENANENEREESVPNYVLTKKELKKVQKKREKAERKEYQQQQIEEQRRRDEMIEQEYLDRKYEEEEKEALEEEIKRHEVEKKEAKELKEYMQWKGKIKVESEGEMKEIMKKIEKEVVKSMEMERIVYYYELSTKYNLSSNEIRNQILELEKEGHIQGIEGEHGEYIYFSKEEMKEIQAYIERKGRLSLYELRKKCEEYCKHQQKSKQTTPNH